MTDLSNMTAQQLIYYYADHGTLDSSMARQSFASAGYNYPYGSQSSSMTKPSYSTTAIPSIWKAGDVLGTSGNDTFYKTSPVGGHTVYAGAGIDTAVYYDKAINFHGTFNTDGSVTVANTTTGVSDTLYSIERIEFHSGSQTEVASVETARTADNVSIYRLYQAAFNRTPDEGGFKYWVGKHDAGMSELNIAHAFSTSSEFTNKYGANQTTDAYVQALYHNVLGRAPDVNGANYWKGQLNSGAVSHDQALLSFADSNECKLLTHNHTDNFFYFLG